MIRIVLMTTGAHVLSNVLSIVRRFAQRRFVRDTLILQAGNMAMMFVQALTNFLLLRILGAETLGVYYIMIAMAAILGFLDFSASGQVALVEVSRALSVGNVDEVRDNLAYFLRINLIINGVLVTAFFVLAPWIAQVSYPNIPNSTDIGMWARWLALLELTEVPFGLLVVAYRTRRDMRTLVTMETGRLLLSSAISIGALVVGWGIGGLILGQLAVSLVYAAYGVYGYSRLARTDPRFPGWSALLRRMRDVSTRWRLGLGFRIAMDKNLSSLATQLPILMMATLSPVAVGYFGTALKVITFPQPLITGIARNRDTFLPHRAGQSVLSLREAFVHTTLFTGLVWSGITLSLALVGPIVVLVIGLDYAPAIPLLYPLLLQSLAVGFGVGIRSTYRSMNRVGVLILVQVVVLAVLVPLGRFLIDQAGAYGGAWFYSLWYVLMHILAIATLAWLFARATPPVTASNA